MTQRHFNDEEFETRENHPRHSRQVTEWSSTTKAARTVLGNVLIFSGAAIVIAVTVKFIMALFN